MGYISIYLICNLNRINTLNIIFDERNYYLELSTSNFKSTRKRKLKEELSMHEKNYAQVTFDTYKNEYL